MRAPMLSNEIGSTTPPVTVYLKLIEAFIKKGVWNSEFNRAKPFHDRYNNRYSLSFFRYFEVKGVIHEVWLNINYNGRTEQLISGSISTSTLCKFVTTVQFVGGLEYKSDGLDGIDTYMNDAEILFSNIASKEAGEVNEVKPLQDALNHELIIDKLLFNSVTEKPFENVTELRLVGLGLDGAMSLAFKSNGKKFVRDIRLINYLQATKQVNAA